MRPRFSTLFDGEWPYHPTEGVGLLMQGLPNDRSAFIAYLMEFSCHPKAGARIYDRIMYNGYDKLTVMASLNFDAIAQGLKNFGVQLSIIAPQPGWTQLYQDGAYPVDFVPPHVCLTEEVI